MESVSRTSGVWTIAALGSAVVASLCCIGPVVIGVIGIGTLGAATALEPLRPYLLGFTAILLGAGFYRVYQKRTVTCADGSCRTESSSRTAKITLWGVTLLALALASFPYWSGPVLAGARTPQTADASQRPSQTVQFQVSGMTCGGCASAVEQSVSRLNGVEAVSVSYQSGHLSVTYQSGANLSPEKVVQAVRKLGYAAVLVGEN